MKQGVILYGAPATGKDTVTAALQAISEQFEHFKRVKCGPGRTAGYRLVDQDELARILSTPGEAVWVNERYGATYVIDRAHLVDVLSSNRVPVIHLGQPDAIDAVKAATPCAVWLVVELICPRAEGVQRIIARSTGDTDARIAAFDLTPLLIKPDLRINTAATRPERAAEAINAALHRVA